MEIGSVVRKVIKAQKGEQVAGSHYYKSVPSGDPKRPWKYYYDQASYEKAHGHLSDHEKRAAGHTINPAINHHVTKLIRTGRLQYDKDIDKWKYEGKTSDNPEDLVAHEILNPEKESVGEIARRAFQEIHERNLIGYKVKKNGRWGTVEITTTAQNADRVARLVARMNPGAQKVKAWKAGSEI